MKPYDIFNLWVLFDKATTDPAFTTEQKIAIGRDMLAALPPEMLCSSSKPSLDVVTEAMKGRLNEFIRRTETGLRAGKPSVASPGGDDQEADAGSGLPLESVDGNASAPKQARKGRKSGAN